MTITQRVNLLQNPPGHTPSAEPTESPQATTTPATDTAPLSDGPTQDRSAGDRELAQAYRTALLKSTGNALTDAQIDVSPLPPHAHFTQYWSLLGRAIQGSTFSQWMTRVGVEPDSIMLTPAKGRISFKLKQELDPKRVVHTVGRNDSQFAAASSEVMAIAKIIAAGSPEASFKPPQSPRSPRAPLDVIRRFQKEPQTPTRAAILHRAAELSRNQAFIDLPVERHQALHESRSETVLERYQAALADIDGQYRVGGKLQELSRHIEANSGGTVDIAAELMKRKVKIPFESSYQPDNADKTNRISLKHYLDDHQLSIPGNREQLDNLVTALMTPTPRTPVNGNGSGALGWPEPVDLSIIEELKAIISQGKVGDIHFGAYKNVLEYLTNKRMVSPSEARDPRHLIDNLVKSPKGKALGAALQAHFQAKSIKGCANDWLLAAINLGKGSTTPAPHADPRLDIEGYPLMHADNAGKTASAVLSELRVSLLAKGKASSAQSAGLYATLLLSSRAPEFLVKDIPPLVVMGSHAWVSFVTAVQRIEATSPGATAAMSYAHVMLRAGIAPITAQEQRVEYLAQNEAIKHWAAANGLGLPTDAPSMIAARTAFDAQIKTLSDAANISLPPTPTVKSLALQALEKAMPDMDPAQFENKCITLQPAYRTFPGPYSVLDLYMDRRALSPEFPGPNHEIEQFNQVHLTAGLPNNAVYAPPKKGTWVSSSANVNINEVLKTLKTLPDMTAPFERAFSAFAKDVEKITMTQVRHLISTLPLEDRQHLEYGKVTVVKEMDLAKTNTQQPRRSRTTEGSVLVKTELDGQVRTYEINRLKGEIIKRRDMGDFPAGERDLGGRHPYKAFEIITPDGSYSAGIRDERSGGSSIPNSFDSERTAFIADAIIKDLELPALKKQAKGETTFDTERPTHEAGIEFVLNLIPLRSSIVNFKKGEVADGLNDLAMDIFGFVISAAGAAKAGKAAFAGASTMGKAAHVAKIIGRTAMGSLNPVSGLDDLARGIGAGARKSFTAAQEGINYLRGTTRNVDVINVIKSHDIAQGTFKSAKGISEGKAMAQFDEVTQQWHAYDPRTQQAYGKPLEGFIAEQSTVAGKADSLLQTGLSQDNVVIMGGRMKNVKFIGPEIHSFEDTYKGAKRLNITVHGDSPRPGNLFLFNGTKAYVDDIPYDAKGLLALLKSKGVSPEDFDNVRLLVCYGANGIGTSFGKKFQALIKRPVKAFEGEVMLNYGSTAITADRIEVLKETARMFPNAKPQHVERMADWRLRKELKTGVPHDVLKDHGKKIIIDATPLGGPPSFMETRINYRPRHYS